MKLLIALSRFPYPLEKGDQLRAFNQLKELSEYYEIHLFCLCAESDIPPQYIREVEPYCASICIAPVERGWQRLVQGVKFRIKRLPLQCAYFFSKRAQRRFNTYADNVKADLILCQLLRMFPYVKKREEAKVLDYQDAFSYGMYKRYQCAKGIKSILWKYEYRALERMEKEAFGSVDLCTIISDQDREHLPLSVSEKDKVKIWPNGVDSSYFHKIEVEEPNAFDLVFTGNMGYSPNEDAAEFLAQRVLPAISMCGSGSSGSDGSDGSDASGASDANANDSSSGGNADANANDSSSGGNADANANDSSSGGNSNANANVRASASVSKWRLPYDGKVGKKKSLLIAGTSPTHIVRSLASEQVTVSGYIKDIRKAYASGKIFVAPMRLGTGMQNKILEAMACELPCIASETAVQGLGCISEECPVISVPLLFDNDTVPEIMIEKIQLLLLDHNEREALGKRGREFVIKYYSWPAQALAFTNWINGSFFSKPR